MFPSKPKAQNYRKTRTSGKSFNTELLNQHFKEFGQWQLFIKLDLTFKSVDEFGWTKKKLLERDLNLRPPDWRAGAIPTEQSSPTLAISLFCQYLCWINIDINLN